MTPKAELIAGTSLHIQDTFHSTGWNTQSDARTDGDKLAEMAGRVCYLSFSKRRPGGNKAYLDNIKAMGHESIMEHVSFTWLLTGISRNCTHELVRHRVGTAFSQLSSRYVDQTAHDLGYRWPEELSMFQDEFDNLTKDSEDLYLRCMAYLQKGQGMEVKKARSLARHALLGSAETAMVFSCNARELRHIFRLRGSIHADPEIRQLAVALYHTVCKHELFSDITEVNGCLIASE